MIVADPHASPKLVGVREERWPPLLSRWLFLGEKPAGFGTERRRRRRARGADDPESRLWTFTNASTLPVGVTTRVCTRGESVFLPLSRPYPAGIPLASCHPRAVPFLDVPSLHPPPLTAYRPPFSSSFVPSPISSPFIHGPAVLPQVRQSTILHFPINPML